MAFQMIPPRVSSSPPPLDSLPSVTCTGDDDEDEEFGSFSTHNTFDITGLSDKLPPTPNSSPSKFPNQIASGGSSLKVAYDRESSATHRYGNDHERLDGMGVPGSSASDTQSSFRVSDINGELMGSQEDDSGDFGDFAHFNAADSTAVSSGIGLNDVSKATGDINSSHDYNEGRETSIDCPSDSANNFSVLATPPPLDYIADNVVIEDEFSRISPNPLPGHEKEFGDFADFAFENSTDVGSVSVINNKDNDVSLQTRNTEESVATSDGNMESVEPIQSSELGLGIGEDNDDKSELQKGNDSAPESSDEDKPDVELSAVGDSECKAIQGYDNDVAETSERTCDFDSKKCEMDEETLRSAANCEEKNEITGDGNYQSPTGPSSPQSSVAQNVNDTDPEICEQKCDKVSSELQGNSCEYISSESVILSASNNSIDDSTSTRTSESITTDKSIPNTGVHKDIDSARTLNFMNNDGRSVEANGEDTGNNDEDNTDFGEFSKAKDDDEDDLDFDDLRERVENGTFGLEESSAPADEFGEIYEYGSTVAMPDSHYDESEEFGDFGSAAATEKETDEFGDFVAVGSDDDDDFGDFAAPDVEDVKKVEKEGEDEEDEFGDFTSQQNTDSLSENAVFSWQDMPTTSFEEDSPVLRKLESLVLKWVPKETAAPAGMSVGNQENHFVPTMFQSVEDDAFVWRQLENLESSAALTLTWGSMQAQTLYLSSVNVDARNIVSKTAMITLFGQKWSSSVPLFAQTLSFSPLTPAKPVENGAALDGGNRGSVTPPVIATTISPKLTTSTTTTSFSKEATEVPPIPASDENGSEEQIPPANFDWTSSGLINPLEGPGLEREFLSEGGEKGACGRMRSPPTPSPLVQQILGSGINRSPSATTPLKSLSTEARNTVEHLPDLGFMRSRVLMFPIRGDE